MAKLPVIVSLGGINAAGRSSFHHGYKRMVHQSLTPEQMYRTWQDLAQRMGLAWAGQPSAELLQQIVAGTLVRAISPACFDVKAVPYHIKTSLQLGDEPLSFILRKNKLPLQIPSHWQVEELDDKQVRVRASGQLDLLLEDAAPFSVSSAGRLPEGFDPGSLYNSRFHPRGLQMTVFAASDCLQSSGLDWQQLMAKVAPDQVAVYAGSALAQVDEDSLLGLIASPLRGGRVSSKMMALSLAEMPADFVNSYIINSVGATGTNMGACATFLYNLRQGANDIKEGRAKVVLVGNAEAPVNPQIMEGFRVMGALAEDHQLCALDGSDSPDNRRACRPFSTNCGFTMAESAQFVMLMDDELALQLGAQIMGSVADVFINADANKKSISAPGVGNYVTVAKAAALAKALLGEQGLRQHTYVQAHGTGTPQNRVTESHILSQTAQHFGIEAWPVVGIKSYLGHSMSVAAGDQLAASLGAWAYGVLPHIHSIDHIAEDVHQQGLHFLQQPLSLADRPMQGVIINSKGFGGNNASALVLSPEQTLSMLRHKHGADRLAAWQALKPEVMAKAQAYDTLACQGQAGVIYDFGTQVLAEEDVQLSGEQLRLTGFANAIELQWDHGLSEYLES